MFFLIAHALILPKDLCPIPDWFLLHNKEFIYSILKVYGLWKLVKLNASFLHKFILMGFAGRLKTIFFSYEKIEKESHERWKNNIFQKSKTDTRYSSISSCNILCPMIKSIICKIQTSQRRNLWMLCWRTKFKIRICERKLRKNKKFGAPSLDHTRYSVLTDLTWKTCQPLHHIEVTYF